MQLKCHPYFPEGSHIGGKDVLDYPETNMRVEFIAEEDFSYFVKRTLKLVNLEVRSHTCRQIKDIAGQLMARAMGHHGAVGLCGK